MTAQEAGLDGDFRQRVDDTMSAVLARLLDRPEPAEFLADPGNRARVGEYLADAARPYAIEVPAALFGEPPSPALGQSYGEMAEALIGSAVSADEPVDLLVLAFSIHDLRPGRQT